jgi:tRNA(Ile2) C34 agmatinyltransferase TiaS
MTYLNCPRCRLTVAAAGIRAYECPRCQTDGERVLLAAKPRRLFQRAGENAQLNTRGASYVSSVSSASSSASTSSASP